jgi:hypothetical protein
MSSDARLALPLGLLALAACRPDFGLPVSVVTEQRIIAVEASPPEALPGAVVHLKVTSGGPAGALLLNASFGFCTSPRPLVEPNVVNADCLGGAAAVSPIADGVQETDATLPTNACLQFGPDTPSQQPGEPPYRPRDPDVTGGFYQPVRVALDDGLEAIALVRIRCNLPNASTEQAVAFSQRYTDNQNPAFTRLELRVDGVAIDPLQVRAGSKVTLHAEWDSGSAEAYVVHRAVDDTLVDHREALRVSWFTTGGSIPLVATGRGEDDPASFTETTWETPAAGAGWLWAVLRDSRGGSAVQALAYTVR